MLLIILLWLHELQSQPQPAYYIYSVDGDPIGSAQTTWEKQENQTFSKKKWRMRSGPGGVEQEECAAVLNEDYTVQTAFFSLREKEPKFWAIAVTDRIVIQGRDKVITLPLQKFHLEVEDFLKALLQKKLGAYKMYEGLVLSTTRNTLKRVNARYLGYQKQTLGLCSYDCHTFKVCTEELNNFWAQTWLDAQGNLIAHKIGKFEVIHTPPHYLQRQATKRVVLKAPFIFTPPMLSSMELKVTGIETGFLQNTAYQQIGKNGVTLKIPPISQSIPSLRELAYGKAKYLEPLAGVDPDLLAQYVAKACDGASQPEQMAKNIGQWVYRHLVTEKTSLGREFTANFGMAADVQALLNLVLCRRSGIPARLVAGFHYYSGKFVYENWSEVYLQNWIPLHNGALGASATFLALFPDITISAGKECPAIELTIIQAGKSRHILQLADSGSYLGHKDNGMTDRLLGIACQKPPGWEMVGKDIFSDMTAFCGREGQVLLLKVFRTPKPWSEILSSLDKRIGQQKNMQILWQQERAYPKLSGMEMAVKAENANLFYRGFIAEKDQKGILVLLIAPAKDMAEAEKNFHHVVASLEFID